MKKIEWIETQFFSVYSTEEILKHVEERDPKKIKHINGMLDETPVRGMVSLPWGDKIVRVEPMFMDNNNYSSYVAAIDEAWCEDGEFAFMVTDKSFFADNGYIECKTLDLDIPGFNQVSEACYVPSNDITETQAANKLTKLGIEIVDLPF